MLFPDENNNLPKEEENRANEDTSYRIVFDKDDPNATYQVQNTNPYQPKTEISHPQPPKEKKAKQVPPALLIVSIVLFALSILLLLAAFSLFEKQSPNHIIGTHPARTDILEPWVNPEGLNSEDSYAIATAKVIDSVVVITTDKSAGSGVVWASNEEFSYILTCYHVIEEAKSIKITLHNGDFFAAEIIGGDSRTDIAILRIEESDLTAVVLPSEDHALSLGQAVIAIGNPLGTLGNSVTNGILSSLARNVTIDGYTMELMQTNAAVNRGNSGGGLFDLNGQLVGLVNAKNLNASVEGIGFAIPYVTLKTVTAELVEKGYVSGRPNLGFTTVTVNSSESYYTAIQAYPDLEDIITQKSMFGTSYRAGIYIVDTAKVKGYANGSQTLAFGDKLTAINGVSISATTDMIKVLNNLSAGEIVQITVVRENKTVNVEVILGEEGK